MADSFDSLAKRVLAERINPLLSGLPGLPLTDNTAMAILTRQSTDTARTPLDSHGHFPELQPSWQHAQVDYGARVPSNRSWTTESGPVA
jgi:hypothetical protein